MPDEYIRRDAAMKAMASQYGACRSPAQNRLLDEIRNKIRRMPAADVVPVTRCKDCKYVRNLGFNFGGLRHDSYFCVYNGPVSTGGDDFCSHGELQTNGGGNNNVSD